MGVGDRVFCKSYNRYGIVVRMLRERVGRAGRFMILWDGGELFVVGETFLQLVDG